MIKISKAVSAALVAAAGLIGSQAALAVTDPATAPSDLFAAVWNSSTNRSYVVDLGVTWASLNSTSTFQNPNGYSNSWQLDTSLAQLTTDLGAATGSTNPGDTFSLFALNYTAAPTPGTIMFGLNGTAAPTITTTQLQSNVMADARTYLTSFMSGSATSVVGSGTSYYASCSAPINPGCNGGSYNLTALNGLGAAATGTGSLNFFQYVSDSNTRNPAHGSLVGNATGAGVFTLSGNTLTYTLAGAAPAVPLPAAGWLLISSLLGLGAVSRRRDGAAAA